MSRRSRPTWWYRRSAPVLGPGRIGRVGRLDGDQPGDGRYGGHELAGQCLYHDRRTLYNNAILLDSFTHTGLLDSEQSYQQSELVTLPISLSGSYNLFVVTNADRAVYEGSNASSSTSARAPIYISQQLADLKVTAVTVTAPAGIVTEDNVTVNWIVANIGAGMTNTNYWYDDVWLSTNNTLGSGGTDVYLGTLQHSNPLAAGDTYSASLTVALPQTLAAGSDYFIVATNRPVAPPNDNQGVDLVAESNYDNNEAAATTATSVSVSAFPT